MLGRHIQVYFTGGKTRHPHPIMMESKYVQNLDQQPVEEIQSASSLIFLGMV